MPHKLTISLNDTDRAVLEQFVAHGKKSAREITRARILLLSAAGTPDKAISQLLGVARGTLWNVRRKHRAQRRKPILAGLKDAPRTGAPLKIDSAVAAKVSMLACSDPPAGAGRWTLQLMADRLVELAVIDSISHESVRRTLKKTTSSRGWRSSGA